MDPILGKILTTGATTAAKRAFAAFFPDRLAETRAELALETATQAWEMVKKLDGRAEAVVMESLAQRISDPEVVGFARVLFQAAVDATYAERRKMLCAALAGGVVCEFLAETRSRVARALLALEPSDIQTLRTIVACGGDQKRAGRIAKSNPGAAMALVQALCIERGDNGVGTWGDETVDEISSPDLARATPVGREVIRMLEGRDA